MCVKGQSFVHESKLPQPLYRFQPGGSLALGLLSMQNQRAPHLPLSLQSSRGTQAGPTHSSEGSFLWFHILWSLSIKKYQIVRTFISLDRYTSLFKPCKATYGLAFIIFNILMLIIVLIFVVQVFCIKQREQNTSQY